MILFYSNHSIMMLGSVKEGAPSLGMRIESGKLVIKRSSD